MISQQEVAEIFGKILGRKVKVMEISESMLLKSLKAGGYPIYDYANVRYYVKELEQNAFAIGGGVTSVVKDITGREPEDFQTMSRKVLAEMPEAKKSLWNTLKALKNFMKILFTKEPDMLAYEKEQSFPRFIHGMKYAQENAKWVKIHENQTNI